MVTDMNPSVQFFYAFLTISVLSLENCCRRWYMQCSVHLRVNRYGTNLAVSNPPSDLSPLLISWGRICFIYYHYLGWSLLIYYGYGEPRSLVTPPPS